MLWMVMAVKNKLDRIWVRKLKYCANPTHLINMKFGGKE